MWLGNEGLGRAELRAGMRFLDVAAGSGALSIPAARLGAQVLATDQSPVMIELLGARARQAPCTSCCSRYYRKARLSRYSSRLFPSKISKKDSLARIATNDRRTSRSKSCRSV